MEERRYSSWTLERIAIGEIIRLRIGVNTVGRHSSSDIRLVATEVSRNHAEIEVSEDELKIHIRDQNSSNGIYVNTKCYRNAIKELADGDIIGLGVIVPSDKIAAKLEFPIYVLKYTPLKATKTPNVTIDSLTIDTNCASTSKNIQMDSVCKSETPACDDIIILSDTENDIDVHLKPANPVTKLNNEIHMPILPSVKQEMVRTAAAEIQNIFGLPDDCDDVVLDKVRDINPYIYKNLNIGIVDNNTLVHGAMFNLTSDDEVEEEELGRIEITNSTNIDEEMLFSQVILNDMKAEFGEAEADDGNLNDSCWSVSDDEEDEELEGKVTDWSNKLFSQNVSNFSQVYDITGTTDADIEDDFEGDELLIEKCDENDFYDPGLDALMDNLFKPAEVHTGSSAVHQDEFPSHRKVKSKRLNSSSSEEENNMKGIDKAEGISHITNSNLIDSSLSRKSPAKLLQHTKESDNLNNNNSFNEVKQLKEETKSNNQISESGTKPDFSTKREELKRIEFEKSFVNETSEKHNLTISNKDLKIHELEAASTPKQTSFKRTIPLIDAPKLPKHKGKLRGISADNKQPVKDLKGKWIEKPDKVKKQNKSKIREGLKQITLNKKQDHTSKIEEDSSLKRKFIVDSVKIKNTKNSRSAMLAEDIDQPPAKKSFKKSDVMQSKQQNQNETSAKKSFTKISNAETTSSSTTITENTLKVRIQRTPSTETFSQQIRAPDSLIRQRCNKTKAKEAVMAPARNCKKITFASMNKNFIESHESLKKLEKIKSLRSCLSKTATLSEANLLTRPKKSVRFVDVPEIHYVESVGANRKVNGRKDILVTPLTTYNDRCQSIRQSFHMVDHTNKITTDILQWSNEWLIKGSAEAQAASDIVFPMTNEFDSFENYKSIIFPLMKLEFQSTVERAYREKPKSFNASLEYVTENKDRFVLITKHYKTDILKYDLAILDFGNKSTRIFAFLTSSRKEAGSSCTTLVFEVLAKNFSKAYFKSVKSMTVFPIVDNLGVEFGAFNAVYQLENTPLFKKIIKPKELLLNKQPIKRQIAYKGFDKLNDTQRQIVLSTYAKAIDESTQNITLIQGPPGTGKSLVITNLALQCLYGNEVRCRDRKILICAQSNCAVDIIAAKLYWIQIKMRSSIQFRVVRFGMQERMSSKVIPISLQKLVEAERNFQLEKHFESGNKENLKSQITQMESDYKAMKARNVEGTSEEHDLLELYRKLKQLRNVLNQNMSAEDERILSKVILKNANIVCTTLSSCVKLANYIDYFDICIIDEATQCTEPWTLLPLKFGISSLILVGDTQQLPATVLSKKALDFGLATSMFTRIQRSLENESSTNVVFHNIIHCLNIQYRMHPEICKWPNQYFYNNKLNNAELTLKHVTPILPFSIINLTYSHNDICCKGKVVNKVEADFIVKLVVELDKYIPITKNSYGIVTPYSHHRNILEEKIRASGFTTIKVNTIDSYQGLENDVIIVSNARTTGVGFLSNYQRLNVALTRARKCLIVCGNFKDFESVGAWRNLLSAARERNLFHELSESNSTDLHMNLISKILVKDN